MRQAVDRTACYERRRSRFRGATTRAPRADAIGRFSEPVHDLQTSRGGTDAAHGRELQCGMYIDETPIGNKSEQSVAQAIAQDPVPNANGKPASPQGTPNNAAPSGGYRAFFAMVASVARLGDSSVKSYTFQDPKGNTWEINVTQDSHTLSPGYILRGVVQGNAVSYGEGTALKQDFGPASTFLINNVWIEQNQKNINEAH